MAASVEPAAKPQPRAVPAQPRVGPDTSISGLAVTAFATLREWVADSLEVAALESRLAGFALAAMSAIAIAATILLLTAWGLVIAAVVAALLQAGMQLWLALLAVAGVNAVVAAVLIALVPRIGKRLTFESTRNIFRKRAAR